MNITAETTGEHGQGVFVLSNFFKVDGNRVRTEVDASEATPICHPGTAEDLALTDPMAIMDSSFFTIAVESPLEVTTRSSDVWMNSCQSICMKLQRKRIWIFENC